jgi:hypothetical protein
LQWEALFQVVWNLGTFSLPRPFKPGGFPANWVWDLQPVWCPPVLAGCWENGQLLTRVEERVGVVYNCLKGEVWSWFKNLTNTLLDCLV